MDYEGAKYFYKFLGMMDFGQRLNSVFTYCRQSSVDDVQGVKKLLVALYLMCPQLLPELSTCTAPIDYTCGVSRSVQLCSWKIWWELNLTFCPKILIWHSVENFPTAKFI